MAYSGSVSRHGLEKGFTVTLLKSSLSESSRFFVVQRINHSREAIQALTFQMISKLKAGKEDELKVEKGDETGVDTRVLFKRKESKRKSR